jgi:hypothetical protein
VMMAFLPNRSNNCMSISLKESAAKLAEIIAP